MTPTNDLKLIEQALTETIDIFGAKNLALTLIEPEYQLTLPYLSYETSETTIPKS